ncbi:dickkopf-related protein 3-like [Osmerus mordax]|uniref:dickkopf-related protein 3-like n=1 Tax=Osmerus mordax TaxID=8014 RepID=UPI003510BDFC
MELMSLLSFCLLFGSSRQYLLTIGEALDDSLERGHTSLNEMFREVEMLMGDTQFILAEAVDQMASESAKSSLTDLEKLGTLLNDTLRTSRDGNHTTDRFGKDSDGITEDTSSMEMNGRWNDLDYECMVDEDCGALSYCLYDVDASRCLPCRAVDMTCNKDEECCSDSMCVWGQCTVNATRGAAGSICQYQSDCRPLHCCAFQRELLFPVCTARPSSGEPCLSHPNLLMDLLAWDQDGPRDHCPCVSGLHCQQQGRGSLCEK